jgi:CHAT domain-containing protein
MAAYLLVAVFALSLVSVGDRSAPAWLTSYNRAIESFNRADFETARAIADRGFRTWRQQPFSRPHWYFRLTLAESLIELDRLPEALTLLQAPPPDPENEGRRAADLAMVHLRKHEETLALQCIADARAVAPAGGRDLLGKIDLIAGTLQLQKDQFPEAETSFRRALSAVQGSNSLIEAYTLIDLGFLDHRRFRYDESLYWFGQARDVARRNSMQRALGLALGNVGSTYLDLGDLDRAIKNLDDAATLAQEMHDGVYGMRWLVLLGETWHHAGNLDKAVECYQKARRLGNPQRDQQWLANILNDVSKLALQKGNLAEASTLNQEGTALARQVQSSKPLLAQTIQSAAIAAARHEYPEAEKIYTEALAAGRRASDPVAEFDCHAGLASVYRQCGSALEAERQYRAAVAVTDRERAKLRQDESKFSFLASLIDFYRDYVDFLMDRGDQAGAFQVAQSCRARVLEEKLHRGGSQAPITNVKALESAARGSGSVLLSFWLAPKRSLLWVIDSAGLHSFALPPEEEIAFHVRRYNDAIQRGAALGGSGDEAGRWLFTNLLESHLSFTRLPRLVIEPDGALHQLNFESLPVGDHYWIEDAVVSIAPSLGLLRRSECAPMRRLLAFGDPGFDGTEFQRLTNLKEELQSVGSYFSEKDVYTASAATPAAYRVSHPEIYSTLHFATHAVANRESPLDSAIVLAGPPDTRKLYARDILDLPLNADLVTLSACQTGGSRTYYGEGLTGFSWAFLSTGARNVVAGLWDIDDRATRDLMDTFYRELASGLPPADALRRAKFGLIGRGGAYRKPRYWAAFEIFTKALYR